MGGFDWIIGAIILVSVLIGIMRGFIKESLSLITWILAVWLGITFCVESGDFLSQYINIPNPKFRMSAGFALIFIGTLFAGAILSYIIIKIFVRGPVKGIDRVLGLGFGALRGAAIVVALLVVARAAGQENADWWQNSSLVSKFRPFVGYAEELLPASWQTEIEAEKTPQDRVVEKILNSTEP